MLLFVLICLGAAENFQLPSGKIFKKEDVLKHLNVDGSIQQKSILLTEKGRRFGQVSTQKKLLTNFQVSGVLESDGIGRKFDIWLTTNEITNGGIAVQNSNEGYHIVVPTSPFNSKIELYDIKYNGLGGCELNQKFQFNVIPFTIKYDAKTMNMSMSFGDKDTKCEFSRVGAINAPYLTIAALDDRNGGNHQIASLKVQDTKKKTTTTKEALQGETNELNYAFTENELFVGGDSVEIAKEKIYLMMGKIAEKISEVENLSNENEKIMKIITNGGKHLYDMLQSQELIIDTSDILFDVETFKGRMKSIQEVSKGTVGDIQALIGSAKIRNKATIKSNTESNHTFFWTVFFVMQFSTVFIAAYLLMKTKIYYSRKSL
ncbi:hypothetical protein EIN_057050 [Entamoeba invadens IP1]|uniref:hypothetical protein n=1 Tax=Entamoeba invadens IP1 TaxID=370355 RepID=UPI0002C3D52C|nr:hypothetical protein EIN_057050 [Entamoeba invadens IP1]ELP93320.1 hypothetical protein EIN_057050 [Entamoeba invadens IP1]|eukprot:XP_004260091.1 hypothetical protein EIN_057050 [Entamoeba invadens IP1]